MSEARSVLFLSPSSHPPVSSPTYLPLSPGCCRRSRCVGWWAPGGRAPRPRSSPAHSPPTAPSSPSGPPPLLQLWRTATKNGALIVNIYSGNVVDLWLLYWATDWLLAAAGSSSGSSRMSSSRSLTLTCFTASSSRDSGFTRCWWTPEQSKRDGRWFKTERRHPEMIRWIITYDSAGNQLLSTLVNFWQTARTPPKITYLPGT